MHACSLKTGVSGENAVALALGFKNIVVIIIGLEHPTKSVVHFDISPYLK